MINKIFKYNWFFEFNLLIYELLSIIKIHKKNEGWTLLV